MRFILAGLALGLLAALSTELLGITITSPAQIMPATGLPVLGVIPILYTQGDRRRRRWIMVGAVSGVLTLLLVGLFLLNQIWDVHF